MTVEIRDVTLRDGIQSLAEIVPTQIKTGLLQRLAAAGVAEIEVASMLPAASSIRQFLDAETIVDAGRSLSGPRISVLAPNARGASRAMVLGVDKIVYVLSASESFSRVNVGKPIADTLDGLRTVAALIRRAHPATRPRLSAAISCAFGCPIEGEVRSGDVRRLALAAAEAGAGEISIADTVGCATPGQATALAAALCKDVRGVRLAGHFHGDAGRALANALAALDAGANALDAALGGLGGCPNVRHAHGNLSIEQLVSALTGLGVACGVDADGLAKARAYAARALPFLFPTAQAATRSPSS